MQKNNEFFARCAAGFEAELARELKDLRIKRTRPLKGGVAFYGDLWCAYRVCLWSRIASRVELVLARIPAEDANALYEGAQSIDWAAHIGPDASIAIHAHGVNDNLRNTQFSAVKLKDAICDQLRSKRGSRPDVVPHRPDVCIQLAIRAQKATISLDLSGEPLHRRGYREDGVQTLAPLKENLAAALLSAAGWKEKAAAGLPFVDPLCGSATLALEACGMACDMAPGIMRDYWGFEGWAQHDPELWNRLLDEADERFEAGVSKAPAIYASDIDPRCIDIARANARRAGLEKYISFAVADVIDLGSVLGADVCNQGGLLVTNPPYGERLASLSQLPALYARIAQGIDALQGDWRLALVTPDQSIDMNLGLKPDALYDFYNGALKVALRVYTRAQVERTTIELMALDGAQTSCIVLDKNADQFAARLRKNAKERKKWAKRNQVSCYRIYDADLPDFAVAIDVYEDARKQGVSYVRMSEYQAPQEIDSARAQARFSDALTITPLVLGVDPSCVFAKTRRRMIGGAQYTEARARSVKALTKEAGSCVEIDLNGYLDTGIFLDHRITRTAVGELSRDKHMLNLFAYTGVASLHAARNKAASTTTVDLSQTYLAWAERNFAANRIKPARHEFVRADVVRWITEARRSGKRYDMIFVDPPTFSNSKSMGQNSWSVQRDHTELLIGVSRLLTEQGVAIFSCNLRNFKLDHETLNKYGVSACDITELTIPHDFARTPKVHHCYIVVRSGNEGLIEPVKQVFDRVYKAQK